jgi:hypothetical protein
LYSFYRYEIDVSSSTLQNRVRLEL